MSLQMTTSDLCFVEVCMGGNEVNDDSGSGGGFAIAVQTNGQKMNYRSYRLK